MSTASGGEPKARPRDRRSFLSQMLRTGAAGLGLAVVGGPVAAAASPRRASASPSYLQCGTFCRPVDVNSCGCPGGQYGNYFYCQDNCERTSYYACWATTCTSICTGC